MPLPLTNRLDLRDCIPTMDICPLARRRFYCTQTARGQRRSPLVGHQAFKFQVSRTTDLNPPPREETIRRHIRIENKVDAEWDIPLLECHLLVNQQCPTCAQIRRHASEFKFAPLLLYQVACLSNRSPCCRSWLPFRKFDQDMQLLSTHLLWSHSRTLLLYGVSRMLLCSWLDAFNLRVTECTL